MIEITIDGRTCSCERGEFILDVARRNGIHIPTLCHHPAVPGRGCCRVCLVEVEERGRRKVVTSCIYPIRGECAVYTNSSRVREERGMVLAFMKKRAPHSDTIAEMAAREGAPDIGRIRGIDMDRCILCGLCMVTCRAMGTGAIAEILRGTEKRVATPFDEPSQECIGCASCAHVCPTGNIECIEDGKTRTIWHRTFDLVTCEECGRPIGTRDELEYAARLAGTEMQTLCDDCRKRETARLLSETGTA